MTGPYAICLPDYANASGTDPMIHDFEGLSSNELSMQPFEAKGEVEGLVFGHEVEGVGGDLTLVDGRDGGYALELTATHTDRGLAFGLATEACPDLSVYDGFSFWGRSDTPESFTTVATFSNLESTPAEKFVEGECTTDECLFPTLDIDLTDEWQKFELSWSDFHDPDLSPGADLDLRVTSLGVALTPLSSDPDDISLQVDDFRFLGGNPQGGSGGESSGGASVGGASSGGTGGAGGAP